MKLTEDSQWNLSLNAKQALNELGLLEKALDDAVAKQKDFTKGSKEYKEAGDEVKKLKEEVKDMREAMSLTGMTLQQLEKYQKDLNREWKNMDESMEDYVEKSQRLAEVGARIDSIKSEQKALREEIAGSSGVWANMKDWITGALAAFSLVNIIESVINFTRESLKMAAEVSDAFGGIQKATGMTAVEVKTLNDEIGKIDTRTAQKSLLDIAQVGGQINVVKEEMLGFVESVDKAVVALGDEFSGGAEEVANKMGVLSKLFKETKDLEAGKAINDIGSAINELGAAGSATGPVVADFATRIGQLGNLAPQISETLGLGAAFQELGLTAEISAGGLTNILMTASKATKDFADHLGMTEDQFKNLINTNPNEVILQLAASFRGMPTDVVVKSLSDLGIKSQEATKVMTLLSDQTEIVREKQELAATAMREGTSLTNEFNVMNNTAAAMLEKQEKASDALKVQLGTFLLPVLLGATTATIAFVKAIQAVPEFISENKEMFLALGAAVIAFNGHLIIATATSLAYSAAEKGRLIWTEAATAAQWAMNVAMDANPIGAIIAAVALFVGGLVYAYQHSETFRGIIQGLWAALKAGVQVVVDMAEGIWQGIQQLIDKFPILTKAFEAISDGAKSAFAVVGDVLDWIGEKIMDVIDFYVMLYTKIFEVGRSIGQAMQPGFDAMVSGFNMVRDAVNSFISMIESGINKVTGFIKSITPSGFTEATKVFTDAGSRISQAFNDAFSNEQTKGHAKQSAADADHNSGKVGNQKKTAEQIAADARAVESKAGLDKANQEELARKSREFEEKKSKDAELEQKRKANEAHRKSEETKAAAAAKKEADDKVKAEKDAIKAIEDAEVKAIQGKEAREIAQLGLSFKREVEKIATSKVNESTMANWIKALSEQLQRDIDKVESDYRKKKIEDEKKRIDEINKLEDQQRTDRQTKEYSTQKTTLDTKLSNEKLSISQRQALKLQLIDLEHKHELDRIEDVAAKERAKANETSAQLMKLAGDDAAKKKQIETDTAASLRAIDTNRIAQTDAANTKHQSDLKANEAASLAERKANQQGFFDAVKALMNGDYSSFMDILNKRLSNEKAMNNERLQNWTSKGQEIVGIVQAGMQLISKIGEAKTAKELANITKEKDAQLKSWKDKYDKGLISKDTYEKEIDKANKNALEKEHEAKVKAWKREQKMQIGMALINGAMAALKSLAMMGFPLGLIGVVASAALTAVQIGIIKSQQPPTMAKGGMIRNAGVPQGPRHGQKYGDSGISLVRRDTNEEVGEMEGDEPIMILSRNTYKNNRVMINALLDSSLHRNGAPIHAAKGTVFGNDGGDYRQLLEPLRKGDSYLFGSKKKKAQQAADEAAAQAAADAAEQQKELDAELAAAQASANAGADTGGYDADMNPYGDVEGGDANGTAAATSAEIGRSQKMMDTIGDNTAATVDAVMELKGSMDAAIGVLHEIKGSIDNAANGTWNTAGAVNRLADAPAMNAKSNL